MGLCLEMDHQLVLRLGLGLILVGLLLVGVSFVGSLEFVKEIDLGSNNLVQDIVSYIGKLGIEMDVSNESHSGSIPDTTSSSLAR